MATVYRTTGALDGSDAGVSVSLTTLEKRLSDWRSDYKCSFVGGHPRALPLVTMYFTQVVVAVDDLDTKTAKFPNVSLTGGNPTSQLVDSTAMTIINVTQQGHRYYPGVVVLQVEPQPNNTSVISVVGLGTGAHGIENDIVGLRWFGCDILSLAQSCIPSFGPLPAQGLGDRLLALA